MPASHGASSRQRGSRGGSAASAESHRYLGWQSDPGGRRWTLGRRAGRRQPDDEGPGPASAARPTGEGSDGGAVPGGGCRLLHRPARGDAHPREPRGSGSEGRPADRNRQPIRRAAAADRDPVDHPQRLSRLRMRITVLTGGTSAERDVALASAVQVVAALRSRGHEVSGVDTARGYIAETDESNLLSGVVGTEPPSSARLQSLERGLLLSGLANLAVVREADVLFLALHGGRGEDGTIQTLLEMIGVPYTGSGRLGSAMAMDKDISKRLFRSAAVPTADWVMAPAARSQVERQFGWPVVVKPSKQGSTVGLSVVKSARDYEEAVTLARQYDDEVMIERFVPGRELTVGILEGRALAVGEIIPRHEIFDYECKYTAGMSQEIFPADLPASTAGECGRLGVLAHEALKLGGYSRVDFRLTPAGELVCLEGNTLPGMTAPSLMPQAAAAVGITFPELCERICRVARRAPPENLS